MQLPYTEVVEEFKTAKARLLVTLDESEDPEVKSRILRSWRKEDGHTSCSGGSGG